MIGLHLPVVRLRQRYLKNNIGDTHSVVALQKIVYIKDQPSFQFEYFLFIELIFLLLFQLQKNLIY